MEPSNTARIQHTVIFKLKYAKGSDEEQDFFNAAKKLANIPGVEKFECLKQISRKNKFEYGLSMEFANQGIIRSIYQSSGSCCFYSTKLVAICNRFYGNRL